MADTISPAERMDRIRRDYEAGTIGRAAAIGGIRGTRPAGGLTDVGAADLLDHELMPSERYAQARR